MTNPEQGASGSRPSESGTLLRAHALAALRPAERQRLDELADHDPAIATEVAAIDAVQAVFLAEAHVRADVLGRREPFGDELAPAGTDALAQLTAAAATAEREFRAQFLRPPVPAAGEEPATSTATRWRRPLGIAALVAAALLALWFGVFADDVAPAGPQLDPRRPADLRAGAAVQLVLLQPTLTPESRTIAWAAVPGASGYDASILDRADAVVLERDDAHQKSTQWELTTAEYDALLALRPLRLRVTALDGVGLPIGSSGDLALTLR